MIVQQCLAGLGAAVFGGVGWRVMLACVQYTQVALCVAALNVGPCHVISPGIDPTQCVCVCGRRFCCIFH